MDNESVTRFTSEAADIVRRAFAIGYSEGQAAVERALARSYEAGLRDAREASGTRPATSPSGDGIRPGRRPRSGWGTVRPAIYAAIAAPPGRTIQEVEAVTGAKTNTVRTTLSDFVADGYASKDGAERFLAVDFERHAALLTPRQAPIKSAILAYVAEHPGATTAEVASALGQRSASVRTKLYQLRTCGELVGKTEGWRIPG